MKSMYKHWGLHISTNINCLEVILDSFWEVWRGLLLSLEPKLIFWWFPRYWWFNKWYYGGYQLICLISWPLLIAMRHDWYQSKGLLKSFKLALRLWKSLKNWWRYDQMKFVTFILFYQTLLCLHCAEQFVQLFIHHHRFSEYFAERTSGVCDEE